MITKKSDYDFVTIPGAIRINGEIMPLRADKHELRGEDPSFLLEADAERHAIWANTDPGKTTMTREIRGDRLRLIALSIREDVTEGRFIKPWPAGPVYDVEHDLATSLNLLYTEADLVSSPDDFTRGHPLVQKDVEKLFTDTDLLRNCNLYKTWQNWNWNNFSITHTYTHGEVGDKKPMSWEAETSTLYMYRCDCYEETDWDGKYWNGAWIEAVASGGTVTLDFSNWNQKYIKPVTRESGQYARFATNGSTGHPEKKRRGEHPSPPPHSRCLLRWTGAISRCQSVRSRMVRRRSLSTMVSRSSSRKYKATKVRTSTCIQSYPSSR